VDGRAIRPPHGPIDESPRAFTAEYLRLKGDLGADLFAKGDIGRGEHRVVDGVVGGDLVVEGVIRRPDGGLGGSLCRLSLLWILGIGRRLARGEEAREGQDRERGFHRVLPLKENIGAERGYL